MPNPARVLIVAGSDSGGGAGIQADIKTVTALAGYAMTAITAVTVQDTTGVHSFHPVPPKTVADQIRVVLADIGADAVKTGMLVSAETVEAIADALAPHAAIPLVVDTVMIAKGGAALLDDAGIDAMKARLFPLAALVTPNAPEAASSPAARSKRPTISSAPPNPCATAASVRSWSRAAMSPASRSPTCSPMPAASISSVHAVSTMRPRTAPAARSPQRSPPVLAQGFALEDAVARARSFVQEAIRTGFALSRGTGPLNHLHAIPPYEE